MTNNDEQYLSEISGVLSQEIHDADSVNKLSTQLLRGAQEGLEMEEADLFTPRSFQEWMNNACLQRCPGRLAILDQP